MWRMAFDIGGTFTDFVLAGAGVAPRFLKAPTTPEDPAAAVVAGFERLLDEAGLAAGELSTVLHATTIATNAIIERKGAPTALITTRGFRDVVIIGRQKRYETYDLHMEKPPPLVPRRAILEVTERLAPDGTVEIALDPESVEAAIDAALAQGARSIAVALLHAYANGAHEAAVAAALAARAPALPVSLSSVISPKFREYERTSTTLANAYVRPVVGAYVRRLQGALAARGFAEDFFIMQSAGGLISPEIAEAEPVRIVESGPAAGVLMAAEIGRAAGEDQIITFDMGGTTAKLGAVDDGRPAVTQTFEVDPIRYRPGSGLPLNVPAVELLEIGAGGGSIARADIGVIHVGPESAGAAPGPICYGQGGTRPTVSDANLVLGYLNPDYFNAGEMRLDAEAARAGIERDIARPLGLTVEWAAWGVHAAANANMERAMRIVSVERGRDPRRFAILAFGGAGRCMPRAWPRGSALRASSCPSVPVSAPPSACWARRRASRRRRPGFWASRPARKGRWQKSSPAWRPGPGAMSRGSAWRGSRRGGVPAICATRDRATRSAPSCRRAISTGPGSRRRGRPSMPPTRRATATATRRQRSRRSTGT